MLFKAWFRNICCSKLLLCVVKDLLIAHALTLANFNAINGTHQHIKVAAHGCRFHSVILKMLDVATIIVYSGGYIFLVFLSVCLGKLLNTTAHLHVAPQVRI